MTELCCLSGRPQTETACTPAVSSPRNTSPEPFPQTTNQLRPSTHARPLPNPCARRSKRWPSHCLSLGRVYSCSKRTSAFSRGFRRGGSTPSPGSGTNAGTSSWSLQLGSRSGAPWLGPGSDGVVPPPPWCRHRGFCRYCGRSCWVCSELASPGTRSSLTTVRPWGLSPERPERARGGCSAKVRGHEPWVGWPWEAWIWPGCTCVQPAGGMMSKLSCSCGRYIWKHQGTRPE